jgi:hypothetical protein
MLIHCCSDVFTALFHSNQCGANHRKHHTSVVAHICFHGYVFTEWLLSSELFWLSGIMSQYLNGYLNTSEFLYAQYDSFAGNDSVWVLKPVIGFASFLCPPEIFHLQAEYKDDSPAFPLCRVRQRALFIQALVPILQISTMQEWCCVLLLAYVYTDTVM